jgi:dienelactone hydrolase
MTEKTVFEGAVSECAQSTSLESLKCRMKPLFKHLGWSAGAVLFACVVARGAEPQRIVIPTANLASSPAPLVGYLFQPAGDSAHPAVVMMHGCGGAYAKKGDLNARHRMWGEYLAQQGYVALLLDSFTSRGFRQLCTTKFSERTLKEADRVGDAYAALAFLRSLPGIEANDIGLLGWSHGGGSALATISHKPPVGVGFRAAVSFYPGCTLRARKADAFHPYAPVLLLIGESDDWTPAAPCKALVSAVAARGEPMRIVTYAGTYHDFDNPSLKNRRVRKDVRNGMHPGQGVTTAPNPAARADALKRVSAFFAEELK